MVRLGSAGVTADLLIVGLGNPGSHYRRTRHNVGYLVVAELARRHGFPKPARRFHGTVSVGQIAGRQVALLMPTTFMNDSGRSVAAALRTLRLPLRQVLVVHDHIDLPFGRIRLSQGGGHGGHNGLRSLHEVVGTGYDRVRVGVDRPPTTDPDVVAEYVLSSFSESRTEVDDLVSRAADAAELWVREGIDSAMQSINAPT